MSASPVARQITQCQSIPSKRVIITDSSQLPIGYSTTPGGTLYSTTPGGTRIVYDRMVLLNLRNSPIARTPPTNITSFPGILIKGHDFTNEPKENGNVIRSPTKKEVILDETNELFEMDM